MASWKRAKTLFMRLALDELPSCSALVTPSLYLSSLCWRPSSRVVGTGMEGSDSGGGESASVAAGASLELGFLVA